MVWHVQFPLQCWTLVHYVWFGELHRGGFKLIWLELELELSLHAITVLNQNFQNLKDSIKKSDIFCPKIEETNWKHYKHEAFIELLRSTTSDMLMKIGFTKKLSACNFVRIQLNVIPFNRMFKVHNEYWIFCCQTSNLIFQLVHQHAEFRGTFKAPYMQVLYCSLD